ncbi:MAG: hypothetical protein M1132_01850 [Chloroflexi bacterium]|nr:hypothetical protein [Chloroflexota bacterium]
MYPSRDRFTLLVILILIALAALALHEFGQLQPLENLAFTFMEPFLAGTTDAQGTARGAFGSFADVNALRAQIADLQAQVDAGKLDHIRVQELELENSTLRQQLSYAQANPDFDLVGAILISWGRPFSDATPTSRALSGTTLPISSGPSSWTRGARKE